MRHCFFFCSQRCVETFGPPADQDSAPLLGHFVDGGLITKLCELRNNCDRMMLLCLSLLLRMTNLSKASQKNVVFTSCPSVSEFWKNALFGQFLQIVPRTIFIVTFFVSDAFNNNFSSFMGWHVDLKTWVVFGGWPWLKRRLLPQRQFVCKQTSEVCNPDLTQAHQILKFAQNFKKCQLVSNLGHSRNM